MALVRVAHTQPAPSKNSGQPFEKDGQESQLDPACLFNVISATK